MAIRVGALSDLNRTLKKSDEKAGSDQNRNFKKYFGKLAAT
jgi:hypothetical protein